LQYLSDFGDKGTTFLRLSIIKTEKNGPTGLFHVDCFNFVATIEKRRGESVIIIGLLTSFIVEYKLTKKEQQEQSER